MTATRRPWPPAPSPRGAGGARGAPVVGGPNGGRRVRRSGPAGWLLAAGTALPAWAWSTGEIAARLASGRWAPVPLASAPALAVRLALRTGQRGTGGLGCAGGLRCAWPPAARRLLPGDAGMEAVAAGLLLAVGVAALTAAGLARRRRRLPSAGTGGDGRLARLARDLRDLGLPTNHGRGASPGSGPAGRRSPGRRSPGARWAGRRDLRGVARVRRPPGRLVVGRIGSRLLTTEARHSVLVFGPTQSGKTSGLAIPAILEWEGPVLATSVKGDLAATTIGWRRSLGQCWVFDPTATAALAGTTPAGWSPLAEAADWRGAQRVAGWMVDATPARSGLTDGAFWFAAAAKQLGPLLLAARLGGRDMADVLRWTEDDEWEEPVALLDRAGQSAAAGALQACAGREDRIRSSVATTLETVLSPWQDPVVQASTAGQDIDPSALLAAANTLYLCGPSFEQGRLQGVFAALVSSVVAAAVQRAAALGRPLDPPLLLVLDEVANIAPIRDLDALASTGAGLGIQLVTVCQDLAQLTARYGGQRAATIANNHRARVMLSGVADLGTLDWMSGLAGEAAVREETVTADLRDGRRTRSSSISYRRLAPTDELRRIRPGEGVVIYGHLPAARVRLRPWYADAGLRRRAGVKGMRDPTSGSRGCRPSRW